MKEWMKILVTFVVCLGILAGASFQTDFWTRETGENHIHVGFVYSEDESTPYTYNFVLAQHNLEKMYRSEVEVFSRSNVLARDAEEPIRELIRLGCNIIFFNLDSDITVKLAAEFPLVQFCQVSLDTIDITQTPENYHTFNGEIYQARYAAGVAAGMKLRQLLDEGTIQPSEALVGYVGANDSAEVISGFTAFFLGIRSEAPEAVMRVKYTNSWSNYNLEKLRTRELIDEGCIIISQHTNTIAPAVACEQAAGEGRRVYYVGYHQTMMDVAPSSAILSIRTNWTPYIEGAVEAVLKEKTIESMVAGHVHGRDISSGFDGNWVQLLEVNQFLAAPGTEEKLNQTVRAFQKGKVDVFKGNYTGVNPDDPQDTIDLKKGYAECGTSSSPSFRYILKDCITVE